VDKGDPLTKLNPAGDEDKHDSGQLGESISQVASGTSGTAPGQTAPPHLCSGPLSDAQESVWFLEELNPGTAVYNNAYAYRLEGPLQLEALKRSIHELIQRHASLRTNFEIHDGQPLQIVRPELEIPFAVADLPDLDEAAQVQLALKIIKEEAGTPFHLDRDPLIRVRLIRLSDRDHILFIVIHHIVTDDWSMGIFETELGAYYNAIINGCLPELSPMETQYMDHAILERERLKSGSLQRQVAYWREKLQGVPPLDLPTDHPRPPRQSFRGGSIGFDLPVELIHKLRQLGYQTNATLFMTLLSAFNILLSRYSGQDDILIGTAVANRNRRELEKLIGYLVNTVVIRTNLSDHLSFMELLKQVHLNTLEALMHQDLSLERLVKEIQIERDLSRNPLFQVLFIYHNAPSEPLAFNDLRVTHLQLDIRSAKVDLALTMDEEAGGLHGSVVFNADLYEASTIQRMIGHFKTLLEGIVANPEGEITLLPLLSEVERHQILDEWNQTAIDYPTGQCLHELVEAKSVSHPEKIAVIEGEAQFTYRDLNRQANALALVLKDLGVGPDMLTGLVLDRSLEFVTGVLAILKAGGAFVPFDPTQPSERLASMILDAKPKVMLTIRKYRDRVSDQGVRVICLDEEMPLPDARTEQNLPHLARTNNLCYVIYTSGSSGHPKGVMVEHASIVNFVHWWQRVCKVTGEDIMAANASPAFDASIWEIFGSLTAGATLDIMPENIRKSTRELWSWLVEHKITLIWLVTSLAVLALEENIPAGVRLRFLAVGGEMLPAAPAKIPPFPLYNFYGPTEATIVSSMAEVDPRTTHQPPIGKPIHNFRIYILDRQLNPVPVGIPGEICIAGAGLARGYLNDPTLTAARFVSDPFSRKAGDRLYRTGDLGYYQPDGQIAYLGRMDRQVKVRGYRIDLGEIESALKSHPGVKDAIAISAESDNARLVAYIIPRPDSIPTGGVLKEYLRHKLPDYMLPTAFIFISDFPLTLSGKIDRGTLPLPEVVLNPERAAFRAPHTNLEQQLVKIWGSVLGVGQIGLDDDFFDLGGHSLAALRLVNVIRDQLGVAIPLEVIFQAPSVAGQAQWIQVGGREISWSPLVEVQPEGQKQPFFCVSPSVIDVVTYSNLAKYLDPEQPFYALYVRKNRPPGEKVDEVVDELDRFIQEIRRIQPQGPYLLGGYSAGGKLAIETARRLNDRGEKVDQVVLFDSFAPGYPRMLPFVSPRIFRALRVLRRIESYFWKFWVLDWRGKWDLASARHGPLLERLKVWFTNRYHELKRPIPPDPFGRLTSSEVKKSQLVKAYSGDITLIRASQGLLGVKPDHSLGWDKWCHGKLQVIITPGDHEAILFGPRLPVVAKILQRCLDSVK
jgi:amino acid adenylation domain-containing protein